MASQPLLDHTLYGPWNPVAGSSDDEPTQLKDNVSPLSINLRHYQGQLTSRDPLRAYVTLSPAATGRVTRLAPAYFPAGTSAVMMHDKAHVWSLVGSTLTNRTGALTFTGGDLDPFTSAMALGFYCFSNGIDEVCFWDGAVSAALPLHSIGSWKGFDGGTATSGYIKGRYLVGFAGRLVAGYMTENDGTHADRIRWCSDSLLNNWYPAGALGSGAVDLVDEGGPITGLAVLPSNLYVLKQDSIFVGRETGDIKSPFIFPGRINQGCLAGESFQAIDPVTGVFLGRDDFYILSGAEARPAFCPLRTSLFRQLLQSSLRQVVSFLRPDLGLYYCCVPIQGNSASRAFVWNYRENLWWIEDYPTQIFSGAATSIGGTSETWNAIDATKGTTWNVRTDTWAQTLAGTDRYTTIVGTLFGTSDWRVHKFDPTSLTYQDLASAAFSIAQSYDTKDFRNALEWDLTGAFIHLASATPGTSINVSASTDFGASFHGTGRLLDTRKRVFFPLSAHGEFVRLRITTSAPISIRLIAFAWTPRYERAI